VTGASGRFFVAGLLDFSLSGALTDRFCQGVRGRLRLHADNHPRDAGRHLRAASVSYWMVAEGFP
jgi:hypothetical protein